MEKKLTGKCITTQFVLLDSMSTKWLVMSFFIEHTKGLCLDPPYSSFVETITRIVFVEESQIDFSDLSKASGCDSMKGPSCSILFEDQYEGDLPLLGSEILQVTLGIPKEISISLTAHEKKPRSVDQANVFHSVRLSSSDQQALGGDFARQNVALNRSGVVEGVWYHWKGDWFENPAGPVLVASQSRGIISSIEFGHPVLLQRLHIESLAQDDDDFVFVIGRRGGHEQWRSTMGGKKPSLLGHQVFARWRGNGSLHRATVMLDEEDLGVFVSWRDGDLTYRSIERSDIVSVVQGHPQHIKSIDELIIVGSRPGSAYQVRELVLSTGPAAGTHVNLIRSGGGLVFEDDVSPAALMYSVGEMMKRNLRIRDSDLTSKGKVGSQIVHGLNTGAFSPTATPRAENRKSLRLFSLYMKFADMDQSIYTAFTQGISPETVSKFINLNDMFNAWLDSTARRDSGFLSARNLVIQSHILKRVYSYPEMQEMSISIGDIFSGDFVCSYGNNVTSIKLAVRDSHRVSDSRSMLALTIGFNDSITFNLEAEFFHSISLLYVPASQDMHYPLSLVVARVESLGLVELIGSVEKVGCGGLTMSPKILSGESKTHASHKAVEGSWTETAKRIIHNFNAVLSELNMERPVPSSGSPDPFK